MINLGIELEGVDELMEELLSMERKANASLARVLNFIAQSTAQRARNNILSGSKSGNIYNYDGRAHRASAPGEAPANLSGALVNSIRYTKITDRPESGAQVGSSLSYAATLEQGGWTQGQFGTVYVEARPFLLPAFEAAVAAAMNKFKPEFEKEFP